MPIFLPTRRFLALFAGASLLFLLGPEPALAADGILLVAFALDLLWSPRRGHLDVRRVAPGRLALGEVATIQLLISNRSSREVELEVTDAVAPPLERVGAPVLSARIGAGEEATVSHEVRADGRGVGELGRVDLRIRGPLGLAWTQRRRDLPASIQLLPATRDLSRTRLLGLRHRLRDAGVRSSRMRGEAGSFESLRPYAHGDDPRTVDWKATARSTSVMVRQFEAERSQPVLIAIDAGRLMAERIGDRERIDHALSSALLLADVAGQSGDRVGLLIFSDTIHHYLPPARASLAALSRALARVEPRLVEPNYPAAVTYLSRQLRRRSLLVLFTDVIDPGASSALLAQLSRSARRHLPLAIALRNPELEAAALAPAAGEAGVYRRAAAEELLHARASALLATQRAGVMIVDVEPAAAGPAVVNRYLEIKARALL